MTPTHKLATLLRALNALSKQYPDDYEISLDELKAEIAKAEFQPNLMNTMYEIKTEIDEALLKFPTWPTNPLHALAILGEEFGELTKAVLQHTYEPEKASLADVKTEAIQTAAMAIRFVRSLPAYNYQQCSQHEQEKEYVIKTPSGAITDHPISGDVISEKLI